jgi:hypothetical protein
MLDEPLGCLYDPDGDDWFSDDTLVDIDNDFEGSCEEEDY